MSRRDNPYKRPDRFTREAKQRGFPARSVFKLEDIDRKVSLFRKGQRVLDLGAAPGSWSLYAGERIGPTGKLLAIDLNPLAKATPIRPRASSFSRARSTSPPRFFGPAENSWVRSSWAPTFPRPKSG